MPNAYKPVALAPMLKGLAAETDYATQPKGTFPRGSNFLLNKRGALDTCDGTQLVLAFNGIVQASAGKVMCNFLFMPTGVPNYYLSVQKVFIRLGPPQNLVLINASGGGSLPAGTYSYQITAIDGAGGETTVSNSINASVPSNGTVTLTWNVVPNAQGYNVYRNGVLLLVAVPQVGAGNLVVSFVDDGTSTAGTQTPPLTDNTQQCALFQMPVIVGSPAGLPVFYNNFNIVALYPADPRPNPDGGGGGGSGGSGGTGGGGTTSPTGPIPTPSGGILGNLSFLPQIVQFTNRAILALGNGYPPQIFSDDTGTLTNPAPEAFVSAISVDAFGVVSVTTATPHGMISAHSGGNVQIQVANYNYVGPTLTIADSTHFTVRNLAAIGQAPSSGGMVTVTSMPIISTFVPGLPTWTTAVAYSTGSIVTPTSPNGHLYKAIQGGVSGGSQPTFPTVTGAQVSDGSIIWQEAGLTNTAAPPPPGCAHVAVYAGSLWMFNTSPSNTSTGLDGPCSLRMSDVNNPNSWNPLNQAFLDKDDGTEGMGLASFTITAQGIPPEGSLVATKNFSTYQIVGIFGSPTLTIQRIKSDLGCLAPRSLQFVPGFGITRYTHLGWAVFDGVDDRIISEDIRPFIFPTGDLTESDILCIDSNWQSVMWGFQTANPPMYCCAVPIDSNQGALNRIFCYDLVLKAWATPIDLPFFISTASQFRTVSANPVTIFGGYSDGVLARWQAGDQMWDVGATGARSPSLVNSSVRLPEAVGTPADQKMNCRRLAIRGTSTSAYPFISVILIVNGKNKGLKSYPIPVSGDWEVFVGYMLDGLRFGAIIGTAGQLELDRFSFHVAAKEVGTASVIS